MYSLLLAIIYLAFISLGLPDSLLGSGWPAMRADLSADVSLAGVMTIIITINTILSSLLSDRLTKKFGTAIVTAASTLISALSLLGFSFATKVWMLYLFAIPYGFAAGGVDAALNNYVALHYSAKHMSWLHCFWGLGALISPYIMGYALSSGSGWNRGYRIVFYVQLAIAALAFATLPVWKKQKRLPSEPAEKNAPAMSVAAVLKIKGTVPLFIAFFAYCAAEQTAMIWASTYLCDFHHFSLDVGAQFASLTYIGITVGRAICGFFADKIGDKRLIRWGLVVMFSGIALMIVSAFTVRDLALAGLLIFGFGCSPVYPCIIHATPDNFGADKASAIIGMQMAFAYTGIAAMPPLFGLIAQKYVSTLPYYILALCILLVVFSEIVNKVAAKARENQNLSADASNE